MKESRLWRRCPACNSSRSGRRYSPWWCVALIRCIPALDKIKVTGDQMVGVKIIKRAPRRAFAPDSQNAGHEPSIVAQKLKKGKMISDLMHIKKNMFICIKPNYRSN
jgi:hypothetical protein